MYLAARFAARAFHRSSAGAVANMALVASRHRCLSSGSTGAGKEDGRTKAGSPAVTVTETVPGGGGKAEQGGVKLDICGDIEGVFFLRVPKYGVIDAPRRSLL